MNGHAGSTRSSTVAIGLMLVAFMFVVPSVGGLSETPGVPTSSGTGGVDIDWTRVTNGLPSGAEYYGVAFGDINNDGKLDAVAQSNGMRAFVGNGAGTFAEQSSGLVATGTQTDVILADFNNDGNLDIAGDNVYFGNGGKGGSMSWTQTTKPAAWYGVAAGDINLDGKMDLVAGTDVGVRAWTGNGGAGGSMVWTAASTGLPNSGRYFGVKLGDINHDGKLDIVAASDGNGIGAWTGNGVGTWTDAYTGSGLPTVDSYMNVSLGDVNHDGNLDIVSTAYYSPDGVRVWLGDGGAGGGMNFIENSNGLITNTGSWIGVSLQDVNNDGNLDIFASHYGGNGLKLWLGNGGNGGSMVWNDVSTGLPTGNYIDIDAGDFNNDGKVDFLASHNNGVDVWQNQRPDFNISSYVSASVNLPIVNTWADVQLADVNRDGNLDIGFTSFQGQNRGIKVFLGDGQGIWTDSSTGLPATGSFDGLRFADVNHDGTLDIVSGQDAGNPGNAGIHVWSGNGAGSWTEMSQISASSCAGLELVDINNDGDLDVVTGHYANGWGPMVFLGNGDFTWGLDVGPAVSTVNVDDVAVADVNHDGKLDFAASSMNNVGIQLWTGDGSGTSTGWTRNDTGLPTTGVYLGLAFADVNHDGNPDLAGTGFAGGAAGMFVWLGNGGAGGTMQWTAANNGLPATGQYSGVEFGDTNVNGDADMVYADFRTVGSTGIGYRRGNGGAGGSMVWSNPGVTGIPTTGQHLGVAFGDMDNDGIVDIAATSSAGVRVYKQGSPPPQAPTVALTSPEGLQNWTGGTAHTIWWNMSDNSPNNNLVVYLNYSYNGGVSGGQIAGPITGVANPNSRSWNAPLISAIDVVVNVTVIDPGGLRAWNEALVPAIDSSPPTVILTNPPNTDTDVLLSQPLAIRFGDSMNTATAVSAFGINPDPGGWAWAWSTTVYANDTMTGTHNDFNFGQTYAVAISQTAMDASSPGNALGAPYMFSFSTLNPNSLPTVAITSPLGFVSLTGGSIFPIAYTTSDAEDPPANLLVWLNYSLTGSAPWNPIAGPIPGDSSPSSWTVPLADTTTAYIRAEALDMRGGKGTNTRGPFEIDSTRPTVTLTAPANGAQNVPRNVVIQATWSEGMNRDETNASFRLINGSTGLAVSGQISWSGNVFSFNPVAELGANTVYFANFSTQAKDDSQPGNNLTSAYSWNFRTASISDNSPPTISDVRAIPSPQIVNLHVNISAIVTDDFGVLLVAADITGPPGSIHLNFSMTFDTSSGRYYLDGTYTQKGTYLFTIWAVDSSGNVASSSGSFEIVESAGPPTTPTEPFRWWIILVIVIVAVAVVLIIWLMKRKKDRKKQEQSTATGAQGMVEAKRL